MISIKARWIKLDFKSDDDKFTSQVDDNKCSAGRESVDGGVKRLEYTNHAATTTLKIHKSGTPYAVAFCNINGLWKNSKAVKVS